MLRNRGTTGSLPSHSFGYETTSGGGGGGYSGPYGSSSGGNPYYSYGGYNAQSSSSSVGGYSSGGSDTYYSTSGSTMTATTTTTTTARASPLFYSGKDKTSSQQRRTSNSQTNHIWKNPIAVLGAASFFLTMLVLHYRSQSSYLYSHLEVTTPEGAIDLVSSLQKDVTKYQRELELTKRESSRVSSSQLSQLERKNRLLQKERDELRVKYEGPDKREEEKRIALRETAFVEQVTLLQKATSRESRREVLERFGPGPHKVKFTIALHTPSKENDDEYYRHEHDFVVQLAPLDLVPHAVHLFLEQVDHELWDGCWFYLNGPHVLQAGPQSFVEENEDGTIPEDVNDDRGGALTPFTETGLDQLAFPEYTEQYPHEAWTLGFTGRPGGPDFYINKVDNTKNHGPGGQFQHVLEEQGDSCFGQVVEGREHVSKIFGGETFNDKTAWHFFMTDPVEIVSARIISKLPENRRNSNRKQQAAEYDDLFETLKAPEKDPLAMINEKLNRDRTPKKFDHDHVEHERDPVEMINDKMKRKPRLPHIEHPVEP